ncbi:MAG TPA: hypothetical protein VI072_05865 [Polyangiaceae bacterium]
MHKEVAQRIQKDPQLLDVARRRVQGWLLDGSVSKIYAEAWAKLLARPVGEVADAIVERSERAHDLRQVSPFAGVVDARTRWQIRRDVKARITS